MARFVGLPSSIVLYLFLYTDTDSRPGYSLKCSPCSIIDTLHVVWLEKLNTSWNAENIQESSLTWNNNPESRTQTLILDYVYRRLTFDETRQRNNITYLIILPRNAYAKRSLSVRPSVYHSPGRQHNVENAKLLLALYASIILCLSLKPILMDHPERGQWIASGMWDIRDNFTVGLILYSLK